MKLARREMILGGTALALSGCSVPRFNLTEGLEAQQVQDILVATNRSVSPDPAYAFEGARSDTVTYADYRISVPSNRRPGEFAFPRRAVDPNREFFVAGDTIFDGQRDFISRLNARVAARPRGDRGIVLFVHGYNVSYPGAVFRAAQIATDFRLTQPMVLFSWPSAGRLSRYAYDRDSVLYARRALAELLKTLAQSQAESITILSHSMGGLLTMEALKRLALEEERGVLGRINGTLLVQADIDVDLFRQQVADLAPYDVELAVVASRRDRALKLSSVLTGGHARVGDAEDIEAVRSLGVLVIDISSAPDVGALGHSGFMRSPELISVIASGGLLERIVAGAPGQDILIDGLALTGSAALAIAYLPYTITGT